MELLINLAVSTVLLCIGSITGVFGGSVWRWIAAAIKIITETEVQAVFVQHVGPTPVWFEGAIPIRQQYY